MCGREQRRDHYRRNLAYYAERAKRGRRRYAERNFERLITYLRGHPCVDRGETDIRVLQFDHVDPSQKIANVSELVRQTWRRAEREIEKCVVRCGNCHRRKTIRERGRQGGGDIAETRGPWFRRTCPIIVNWAVSSVDRAAAF